MKKNVLALLMILAMLLGIAAGCGTQDGAAKAQGGEVSTASAAEEAPVETAAPAEPVPAEDAPQSALEEASNAEPVLEAPGPVELPLTENGETFTFWVDGAAPFVTVYLGSGESYNTAACTEYLESITGVHIEYKEVNMFSAAEEFALMVASQDYTDMISNFANLYSGGYAQGYQDEVVLPINDLVESSMPYYKHYLDMHPEYLSELVDDEGNMLFVSGFQDESYTVSGAEIRQDWLDQLKLDTPVTFDDWHDVALAFKNEYDTSMTVCMNSSINPGLSFSRGFGLPGFSVYASDSYFYQQDGAVKAAYTDDSMKEFIKMLAQWYDEGLISQDFYTYNGGQDTEGNIIGGDVGIFWSEATFVQSYNAMSEDPNCNFVGLQSPVREEGQEIHFSTANSLTGVNPVTITTACENPELLAAWLDYHFTEEGQLLSNYGMEDGSFEYDENGQPKFNDFVANNPDGLNFKQTTSTYILYATPSIFDADCQFEVLYGAQGTEAIQVYSAQPEDNTWAMPNNLTYTNEESDILYNSGAISDMDTTAAEYLLKFVTGALDVDSVWAEYVKAIEDLGLPSCIAAKQSALDRYYER